MNCLWERVEMLAGRNELFVGKGGESGRLEG